MVIVQHTAEIAKIAERAGVRETRF